MMSEEVEPCPACDGWRSIGRAFCNECYEGQIDLLTTALRHIRSLDAKNVPKYAQQIAGEALDHVPSRLVRSTATRGGPTITDPDRPYCKADQSCCDFCCGN